MVSWLLLSAPPLFDVTLIVTGLVRLPRAYTVMATDVPEGAQPGPSSNKVPPETPHAALTGPEAAGSSVLFWCQPGTKLMPALRYTQWLPPFHG